MNRRVGKRDLLAHLKSPLSAASAKLGTLGARLRLRLPFLRGNRRRGPSTPEIAPGLTPSHREPRSARAVLIGVLTWLVPLAATALAFALPVLGARSYDYVMESGYFNVRHIVLDQTTTRERLYPEAPAPTAHFSKNEILEIAGINAGTHLLEADLDAMTAKLEADPWIRWARIERELPDTLVVHVIEHVPMAFIAPKVELVGDVGVDAIPGLALVDELGEVFAPAPFDEVLDLPVISGMPLARLENAAERPTIQKELATALNVLRIWSSQKLSRRFPVSELRMLAGGAYALVLEGRVVGAPTEVVLGRGPFREKLMRLEFVLEHLQDSGKLADYVLLDLGDEADPRAVDIAGARVVVKAKLGIDVNEAIENSVKPTGPTPAHDPSTEAREAAPETLDERPLPAVNARPASDPQAGAPTVPGATDGDDTQDIRTEADAPGEGAPLTGGRPADAPGEE